MPSSFEKYQKRRLRSSYVSVVISIALVLFMVGMLGLVLLKSNQIANHFKDEVVMTLFLKNNVTKAQTKNLEKLLKGKVFTKELTYISKEDAAKSYSKELGEDFVSYLGTNPLKNSIDINLNPDFVAPEKMETIATDLQNNAFVFEVSYDKTLVTFLTQNIKKISFWLLIISGFFALISMILINSSIRLSVYAKRFNIKTMQMVGATKSFIRKPFVFNSIKLGVFGAILALVAIGFIVYSLDEKIPTLQLLSDYLSLIYLGGGIILIAIFMTWISTFFATQRFLNLKTDELYY